MTGPYLDQDQGWMFPPELEALEFAAKRGGNLLEIGCWKGLATSALVLGRGFVECVDPFTGNVGESCEGIDTEGQFRANMEQLHVQVINDGEFTDHWAKKIVHLHRMTSDQFFSSDMPKLFMSSAGTCQLSLMTVLVDGLHEREQVRRDLDHSWEILAPDGWLFVDDMNFTEVQAAVQPWAKQKELPVFWVTKKLGFFVKPGPF